MNMVHNSYNFTGRIFACTALLLLSGCYTLENTYDTVMPWRTTKLLVEPHKYACKQDITSGKDFDECAANRQVTPAGPSGNMAPPPPAYVPPPEQNPAPYDPAPYKPVPGNLTLPGLDEGAFLIPKYIDIDVRAL